MLVNICLKLYIACKKVFIVWFRYGHFDNRPEALFEPNHCAVMKHAVVSIVRQPAGKYRLLKGPLLSEKKTQRRIDSFRFFIPPPMTVTEESSDGLTPTNEQTQATNRKQQILSRNSTDHRRSMTNQTPNQDWQTLVLGFLHTSRGSFPSQETVTLESRRLSSEASMLHGSIAGGACIALKTKTM